MLFSNQEFWKSKKSSVKTVFVVLTATRTSANWHGTFYFQWGSNYNFGGLGW